jgi:hypothetical protein
MSNSIITHINSRVTQTFNQILLIKRHLGTQSIASRASPVFQPINSSQNLRIRNFAVHRECLSCVLIDVVSPDLFSVPNIPLVTKSNDTFILRSGNNFIFWFKVGKGLSGFNEFFSDKGFSINNFHALVFSYGFTAHNTFIETFCVSFFFCLGQFFSVILGLNSQLVTNNLSSHISVSWNIYYRYWLKAYHLCSDSVFFSQFIFILNISVSSPIVWRV